jgi:hypothetical protein
MQLISSRDWRRLRKLMITRAMTPMFCRQILVAMLFSPRCAMITEDTIFRLIAEYHEATRHRIFDTRPNSVCDIGINMIRRYFHDGHQRYAIPDMACLSHTTFSPRCGATQDSCDLASWRCYSGDASDALLLFSAFHDTSDCDVAIMVVKKRYASDAEPPDAFMTP